MNCEIVTKIHARVKRGFCTGKSNSESSLTIWSCYSNISVFKDRKINQFPGRSATMGAWQEVLFYGSIMALIMALRN